MKRHLCQNNHDLDRNLAGAVDEKKTHAVNVRQAKGINSTEIENYLCLCCRVGLSHRSQTTGSVVH